MFIKNTQNYFHHGPSKLQNAINEIELMAVCTDCSKRVSLNWDKETTLRKEHFIKADHPLCFTNSIVNEFQKGR